MRNLSLALVPLLALAACGENTGWNPNYSGMHNGSAYADYLQKREVALHGRGPVPDAIPVQLPANLIPRQNLKKPPDAPFNRLSPAKKNVLAPILKQINPLTSPQYGRLLDAWLRTAMTDAALVQVLKSINPVTSNAYGPLLDAWVRQPGSIQQLVTILRSINPTTATGYGPLLDAWLLSLRV